MSIDTSVYLPAITIYVFAPWFKYVHLYMLSILQFFLSVFEQSNSDTFATCNFVCLWNWSEHALKAFLEMAFEFVWKLKYAHVTMLQNFAYIFFVCSLWKLVTVCCTESLTCFHVWNCNSELKSLTFNISCQFFLSHLNTQFLIKLLNNFCIDAFCCKNVFLVFELVIYIDCVNSA